MDNTNHTHLGKRLHIYIICPFNSHSSIKKANTANKFWDKNNNISNRKENAYDSWFHLTRPCSLSLYHRLSGYLYTLHLYT